ncbi:putative leucine-rich repeat receptor-like protein kinase At2g19210 [Benincasa hispida]|uniref:putative leucine-rich repeat receptor-like protein kinase At2g19210 n=1 Tax=Benincasa hispida TaxID=102211 RepID=UPI001901B1D3|nr:putative leucine-rich repeat receptor-like protein kinase At2g19210 [Benincasa hispida]
MQYKDVSTKCRRTLICWRRPDKLIGLLYNNSPLVQVDDQSSVFHSNKTNLKFNLQPTRKRFQRVMMNKRTRCFLIFFSLVLTVQAQDQSGFISLDCGLSANSTYIGSTTNITYISDAAYINSGESKNIELDKNSYEQHLWSLRSFPEGTRNCYNISNITSGTKYLIRASFLYGNYDGLRSMPVFNLYFGDSLWVTVNITLQAFIFTYEIIHIPSSNRVHICLINVGVGTPFISALEFRPLPNYTYPTEHGSFSLFARLDIGSTSNISYRFPYDVFDRIWHPSNNDKYFDRLNTSSIVDVNHTENQPAAVVMGTTIIPKNVSRSFSLMWESTDENTQYYVYLYFAELIKLHRRKQFRGFNINHNGKYWKGPVIPKYLNTSSIYDIKPLEFPEKQHSLTFTRIENSTLPPIFNAAEIYSKIEISELESDQGNVDAIRKVKSTYGVIKDWEGDPCIPRKHPWSGVGCSNESIPRIITLNLSSSGLTGDISPYISNLTALQTLDLSNNSLTGKLPDSLSKLSNLKVLNLENNNLSCPIPLELIRRYNDSSLSLSVKGNPNLECTNKEVVVKEKKEKNKVVIPVVASIGGLLLSVIIAGTVFWIARSKGKRQGKDALEIDHPETNINVSGSSLGTRRRQFTYTEVVRVTNNFVRILGRGSSGAVYHGMIDDIQVAVKMLAPSAIQGHDQFKVEECTLHIVTVILDVHHRNLTNLVGYLSEGTHLGLIFEYMPNGSLAQHLSEISSNVISWEDRLRIAMDAAQGLEYLHDGCKPPIIHGNVKPTNILLTENFQAKLSDFSVSKSYPTNDNTSYLDPEYTTSNRLSPKSDVYSFGLTLLEIVCCKPMISKSQGQDSVHIIKWVGSMIAKGDFRSIADQRLKGEYNITSVRKAVEVAMVCVSGNSERRPTMNQVVAELKSCLAIELSRRPNSQPPYSTESIEMTSIVMALPSQSSPMAR